MLHGNELTREERYVLEEKYAGKRGAGFERDRDRLAFGEPVAYVIGHQPFLGLTICLDSHPLIPRPETEWWVERLLESLSANKPLHREHPLKFLDLCAGSGAIGCAALARLRGAEVWFAEIDPAHEATIQKNIGANAPDPSLAARAEAGTRVHVVIGDLFDALPKDLRFDVVAANPPYIPLGRTLPHSVRDFEPREALYAGADGLDLILRIAEELPNRLSKSGVAYIECDAEHAEESRARFARAGFSARVMHDQYDRPRVIVVSFA